MTESRGGPRTRILGAGLAVALIGIGSSLVAWIAGQASLAGEALTDPLAWAFVGSVAISGAAMAPLALRIRRRAIVPAGIGAGFVATIIAILVSLLAGYVSVVARGAGGWSGVLVLGAWGLYALAVYSIYALVLSAIPGVVWVILLRTAGRWSRRMRAEPSGGPVRPRSRPMVIVLAIAGLAALSGVADGAIRTPVGTSCLDLGGEAPVAGAWSPDGTLLAIASTADPNEPGQVRVYRWPSKQLVAQWTGWVDQTVAVGPSGDAYWSAWVLGVTLDLDGQTTAGTLEARPGARPDWLASGEQTETALWSLVWTTHELRGMTPNSHLAVRIPLDGPDRGRVLPLEMVEQITIGSLWSSPDGAWVVTTPEWFGDEATVVGPDGDHVVSGVADARSVSMTADRRMLVVSSWSDGTWAIDVATGDRHRLLTGSQLWSATSARGDIVWADDDEGYPGVACVARLV